MNEQENYVRNAVRGLLRIESWESSSSVENGWIELHNVVLVEDTEHPMRRAKCRAKSLIVDMEDIGPKDRYLRLLEKLLVLRTKPEYTVQLECEYTGKLDVLWWQMSDEEQGQVDPIQLRTPVVDQKSSI
jgi:hypothetical protein